MKFIKLKEIIKAEARARKVGAGYSGSYGDGGSSSLLDSLESFKMKLVVEYDLRPSEYNSLNEVEVGEPSEFKRLLDEYKIVLAKNIKL